MSNDLAGNPAPARNSAFLAPASRCSFKKIGVDYTVHGDKGPWMVVWTLGREGAVLVSDLYQRLAASARLIILKWPETRQLDAVVKCGLAAMDSVGAHKAVWYGSSVGGAIVQTANLKAPDRVSMMALANTALPVPWAENVLRLSAAILSLVPEKSLLTKFTESLPGGISEDERILIAGALTKQDLTNWLLWGADFHRVNLRRLSKRARRKPTLIIETDNDPRVPRKHRERLKKFYDQADIICFEGGGHYPQLLHPDAYVEALLGFIGRRAQ